MVSVFYLVGCANITYQISDEDVTFNTRSWNHDPIIKKVKNADPATFRNLNNGYGADKSKVFYKGDEIPEADPTTFKQIKWAYSKDANHVYLHSCLLESANPNEFLILGGSWSKDRKNVYRGRDLIQADVESFRYLGDNWAIDKNNAYHALEGTSLDCVGGEFLKVTRFLNIDIESFVITDGFKAKDKNGKYDVLHSK